MAKNDDALAKYYHTLAKNDDSLAKYDNTLAKNDNALAKYNHALTKYDVLMHFHLSYALASFICVIYLIPRIHLLELVYGA